jgi:hypothetical protein
MKPPLYFVESIWIEDKRYFFSFREIIVPTGLKFCIVTLDKDQLVVFELKTNRNGDWKIVPPVPDWIESLEARLVNIIEARTLG